MGRGEDPVPRSHLSWLTVTIYRGIVGLTVGTGLIAVDGILYVSDQLDTGKGKKREEAPLTGR